MPPAPLPVLAGVYYATVTGAWDSFPSTNRFAFHLPGVALGAPVDVANAQMVSNKIAAHWPTFAAVAFQTTYSANDVGTYPLGSPLVPAQHAAMTAPGGETSPLCQATTAAVVKHNVDRRGRGSQSRSYISPLAIAQTSVDGASMTTLAQGALTSAFDAFMTAVLSDLDAFTIGWTYVQLSKKGTGATYQILSSGAEPRLSTQRRRARR